jgi:SNF2 family DNA or RNA helicase
MTKTLDLIESMLSVMGINFARFDGKIGRETRQEQIAKFSECAVGDGDTCPILLLSTRAGGVGINLQIADTVIIFDSDWNPQMDLQVVLPNLTFRNILVQFCFVCNRLSAELIE